jgi:two-component system nitrogen regulation response regulator GlnG
MARILIVDDQDRTAALCRKALPEHEYTGPARSWNDAEASIREKRPDLVLLDVHFDIDPADLLGLPENADDRGLERTRREQGIHILDSLRKRWPDLPVILMTARGDLPLERAAERLDAEEYTYFLDDDGVDAATLKNQINGIVRTRQGREREGPVYWGRTVKMQRIRQRLHTLSKGRLPVILAGPTGTGKSLVARHVLHRRSERRGRFVSLDLSTIPRDLVGAQLFGSVKGAYTGSIGDRPGAFEEAQGGTLFLDEIGNLPEPTQKMLLTVLQEGVVTRIGESREREIDVKLVVASHEDLGVMVREGRFRQDLYMRLNPACTVALPPLCERDIPMEGLAEFFLQRALSTPTVSDLVRSHRLAHSVLGDEVRVVIGDHVPAMKEGVLHVLLPARSLALLREHPWPGNLRELAMVMENALVFALAESGPVGGRGDVLQCRPKLLRDLLIQTRGLAIDGAEDGFGLTVHLQPSDTLNRVAADVEQQYFRALFLKYEGDFGQMAEVLMGDPECARKVQLRFNQLGLKVREMKRRMG